MTGNRIKALREARGMTLTQLAQAVGVSVQAAWNWESNLHRRPSVNNLMKIADVLGTSLDALLRPGTTSQQQRSTEVQVCGD